LRNCRPCPHSIALVTLGRRPCPHSMALVTLGRTRLHRTKAPPGFQSPSARRSTAQMVTRGAKSQGLHQSKPNNGLLRDSNMIAHCRVCRARPPPRSEQFPGDAVKRSCHNRVCGRVRKTQCRRTRRCTPQSPLLEVELQAALNPLPFLALNP
jgi:hypothetical protein